MGCSAARYDLDEAGTAVVDVLLSLRCAERRYRANGKRVYREVATKRARRELAKKWDRKHDYSGATGFVGRAWAQRRITDPTSAARPFLREGDADASYLTPERYAVAGATRRRGTARSNCRAKMAEDAGADGTAAAARD